MQSKDGDLPIATVIENRQKSTTQFLGLSNLRVLLVEDEPDIAELLTFVLEEAGAEVRKVICASAALKLLQQYQPDILLSNIKLPDEDGISLMKKLRRREAEQGQKMIPAIAVSSYVREVNSTSVIEAGFQWYITKPIDPDELIAVIAELTVCFK